MNTVQTINLEAARRQKLQAASLEVQQRRRVVSQLQGLIADLRSALTQLTDDELAEWCNQAAQFGQSATVVLLEELGRGRHGVAGFAALRRAYLGREGTDETGLAVA